MAISVGSFGLTFLRGAVRPPVKTVELLAEAGVNGFGAREGPVRGAVTILRGTDFYANVTAAFDAIDAARALREGGLVTVENEFAKTYDNCIVLEVLALGQPRPVLDDGVAKHQVVFEFHVMQQAP